MSDKSELDPEGRDVDRDAILARRKALVSRALDGLRTTSRAGTIAALAATGLAGCPIAQACLSIAIDDDDTGCDSPTSDTGETGGTETGGTETGETETETGC